MTKRPWIQPKISQTNSYSIPKEKSQEGRDYFQKKSWGWIKEYESPGGVPILFVKRNYSSTTLCVDYSGLNAVIKKNRYPIPKIREALNRRSRGMNYTKQDSNNAYYYGRIGKGDQGKTVFKMHFGLFQYTVILFGLLNTPATFRWWINCILKRSLNICCLVYYDHILIYSNNLRQHRKDVQNCVRTTRKAGMKLKPSKCQLHNTARKYLEFIINPKGVPADPVKTMWIEVWETPITI